MKTLLLILSLFSFSANAALTKAEQESGLLKVCITTDDEFFQLMYRISDKDDLIIKALIDEQTVELQLLKSTDGADPGRLDYWKAMEVTVKTNLSKLMQDRIDLVKRSFELKYRLSTVCSKKVFQKEVVKEVCNDTDIQTKRWCQSKFF